MDILGFQGQLTSTLLQSAMYNRSIGQIWRACNDLMALADLEGIQLDFLDVTNSNPLNPSVSDQLAMEHWYAKCLRMTMKYEKDKLAMIRSKYRNSLKVVGPTKPKAPKAPEGVKIGS